VQDGAEPTIRIHQHSVRGNCFVTLCESIRKMDSNPYFLLRRKVLKGAKPSDLPGEQPTSEDWSPSETAIGGSHRKKVIRRGLCWILDSADEIAMLPGWQESKGACAEKATAEAIGLPVRYLKQKK
jgi:hypothetical protein